MAFNCRVHPYLAAASAAHKRYAVDDASAAHVAEAHPVVMTCRAVVDRLALLRARVYCTALWLREVAMVRLPRCALLGAVHPQQCVGGCVHAHMRRIVASHRYLLI